MIGSGTTLEYRDGAVHRTRGVDEPIDDDGREFAYDAGAQQALAAAAERDWLVVSMKDDVAEVI